MQRFQISHFSVLQLHTKNILWSKCFALPTTMPKYSFSEFIDIKVLLGSVEELLYKLDPLCFTCQHMDWLYTLFKYEFSWNIVVKTGAVVDKVERAVLYNQRSRGVDRMPSIAKKRPLRKKYRRRFLSSFQKKQRRPAEQFSQKELNKLTKNRH